MSTQWLLSRREFLVRDFIRDYCQVYALLQEQVQRFDFDRSVSYSGLRELLGEPQRKGIFWSLKDIAHHLFRNNATASDAKDALWGWSYTSSAYPRGDVMQRPIDALLDWCIGYAFHECAKLKEDAFQRQHYGNLLIQLGRSKAVEQSIYTPLAGLVAETAESTGRELQRIMRVLGHAMTLLPLFFAEEQTENRHVARWIVQEEALVRMVFGEHYLPLLRALLRGHPQRLPVLAARDLCDAGRHDEAQALLLRAKADHGLDDEGLQMLDCLLAGEEGQ